MNGKKKTGLTVDRFLGEKIEVLLSDMFKHIKFGTAQRFVNIAVINLLQTEGGAKRTVRAEAVANEG